MERVFSAGLGGTDEVDVRMAMTRLRAMKYKMCSYVSRTYRFQGDVVAVARGTKHPITAHREERLLASCERAQTEEAPRSEDCSLKAVAIDKRSFPVPYIDWSAPESICTSPVTDVYITNSLMVRIVGEPGRERANVEITSSGDLDHQLDALASVCKSCGFAELSQSALDLMRKASQMPFCI